MEYEKGYKKIEIPEDLLSDAQSIIIKGFMLEGEFRFREEIISALKEEIDSYSVENGDLGWLDGMGYAIHLIKNINSKLSTENS